MELKRVVVTGMGAITPLGLSVPEYWEGLTNGISGAADTKQFDVSKFKTKFACEVKNFEPTNYLDKKEARKIDRFTQFALVASDQAVENAGITSENVNHKTDPTRKATGEIFLKKKRIAVVTANTFTRMIISLISLRVIK